MEPKVNILPVKSSNIAGIGYDPDSETMHVKFSNGNTYQYMGVDNKVYDDLIKADSIGSQFASSIKSNFTGKRL